jgi:hypothetical protein
MLTKLDTFCHWEENLCGDGGRKNVAVGWKRISTIFHKEKKEIT